MKFKSFALAAASGSRPRSLVARHRAAFAQAKEQFFPALVYRTGA